MREPDKYAELAYENRAVQHVGVVYAVLAVASVLQEVAAAIRGLRAGDRGGE